MEVNPYEVRLCDIQIHIHDDVDRTYDWHTYRAPLVVRYGIIDCGPVDNMVEIVQRANPDCIVESSIRFCSPWTMRDALRGVK